MLSTEQDVAPWGGGGGGGGGKICSVLSIFLMRARFQEERTEEPRKIGTTAGASMVLARARPAFMALLGLGLVFPTVGFS